MIDLQTKWELQAATKEWVDAVMSRHQIPAHTMADVLNHVLVDLHHQSIEEYIKEQQQKYQDNLMASNDIPMQGPPVDMDMFPPTEEPPIETIEEPEFNVE